MTGIGNDIVALNAIDISRSRSSRFYSKILSVSEQQLYHNRFTGIPLAHFVWLLWSVKESVYKCLQRQQHDLLFQPVKIEITQLTAPTISSVIFPGELENIEFIDAGCFCSEARFESQLFTARSVIYGDEVIFTVAQPTFCHVELAEPAEAGQPRESLRQALADNAFSKSNINCGIKKIALSDPEAQSIAVRKFLLHQINPMFPGQQVNIGKSASGYPFIMVDGLEQDMSVSLSHHGVYVGYALKH